MDPLLQRGSFEIIHDLDLPASLRLVSSFIGLPDSLAQDVRNLLRIYWTRKPGQIGTSKEGGDAMLKLISLIMEFIPKRRKEIGDFCTYVEIKNCTQCFFFVLNNIL